MNRLATLNLIHVFDFYLAAMLLLSVYRRFELYRSVGAILFAAPARWPKLLQVMKQHRAMVFTTASIRPLALALAIWLVQIVASRLIWPHADLTPNRVLDSWVILPLLLVTLLPMLGVDVYFLIRVGRINRQETLEYMDLAESWLTGWKAPVVRALTFGFIDPRQRVDEEVRKALAYLNQLLNTNLYWMALQTGCRVAFGLALWLAWAFFVSGA
ncbi:MAG: hypothetical protein ACJ8F7_06450 [Gemmataceae bacterium]